MLLKQSENQIPMLAHPTGTLTRNFCYDRRRRLALREAIVNPEGVIKAYEIHDNGIGRNAENCTKFSCNSC